MLFQINHHGWCLRLENLRSINIIILHPLIPKLEDHNIEKVIKKGKKE